MFIQNCSKQFLDDEFKNYLIDNKYLEQMWNKIEIKIYCSILNNIKKNMRSNYILHEYEWKFYLKQLKFCEKILKSIDFEESYKSILLYNLRIELNYLCS